MTLRANTARKQARIEAWLCLLKAPDDYIQFKPSVYGLSVRSFEHYLKRASNNLGVTYKMYCGGAFRESEISPKDRSFIYVRRMS